MNFSMRDMYIMCASLLAIIFMTLMFPAMGFVDETAANNSTFDEFPDMNIDENQIELVAERPAQPQSIDEGELRYEASKEGSVDSPERDRVWIRRDSTKSPEQIQLLYLPDGIVGDQEGPMVAQISAYDASGNLLHTIEEPIGNDVGNFTTINNESYEFYLEMETYENNATSNFDTRASFEVVSTPFNEKWYSGIPVLGGLLEGGAEVAAMMAWLITMIFWFCAWIVELAINLLILIVTGVLYMVRIGLFFTDTQSTLFVNAQGWAKVFVLIPNVIFFSIIAKILYILASLAPTT